MGQVSSSSSSSSSSVAKSHASPSASKPPSLKSIDSKDFYFVSEPDDDLVCLICFGLAKEPLQHEECGKLFCKVCLEKHGKWKPCPNCRQWKSRYFMDRRSKRAIQAIPVKCRNVKKGCVWVGSIRELERHMVNCPYTLVPCFLRCKDSKKKPKLILRKDIPNHIKNECPNRPFKCELCQNEGTFHEITKVHDKVCPLKMVHCPINGCPAVVERQALHRHKYFECGHIFIACKYQSIGCPWKGARKLQASHHKDSHYHIRHVNNRAIEMKKRNEKMREDIKDLHKDMFDLRELFYSFVSKQNKTDDAVHDETGNLQSNSEEGAVDAETSSLVSKKSTNEAVETVSQQNNSEVATLDAVTISKQNMNDAAESDKTAIQQSKSEEGAVDPETSSFLSKQNINDAAESDKTTSQQSKSEETVVDSSFVSKQNMNDAAETDKTTSQLSRSEEAAVDGETGLFVSRQNENKEAGVDDEPDSIVGQRNKSGAADSVVTQRKETAEQTFSKKKRNLLFVIKKFLRK